MKGYPADLMRAPILLLLLPLLALLAGCKSKPLPPSGDLLTGVGIEPPQKGEWFRMNRPDKRLFFTPNNSVTDEDLVVLTVEALQFPQEIASIEDAIPLLGLDDSEDIVSTTTETLVGTPVVRWHLHKLDAEGTPDSILSHLNLGRRESRDQYFRRSKGIIMKHPNPARVGSLVRIGISRTSVHGYIGTHYEDIAVDFISRFILLNDDFSNAPR